MPAAAAHGAGARTGSGSNGRIRVLTMVDRAADYGGAERFAVALAQNLPADRIESWLCTTRQGDRAFEVEIAASGIPHKMLGRRAKWDVHRLGGLAALLRSERFDVLHAHKFGSNLWGSLIGRGCGVPVIVAHEHTWSYSGNPLRVFLDGRVIGSLATRFIAVSPLDAQRMISIEHVPARKVQFIPTAYIPRPGAPASDIRAELGLTPQTPLIGVAAVLRPQKALEVMLEALSILLARVPDAHLVIAGDGECQGMLEDRAAELGITQRLHLLGRRDDVEGIIRSADVAALSSDYEGLPLFVFECMANGTPLVATAVGGLGEVVESGVSGVLVPPRDPAALAGALGDILTDPARAAAMAEAARERLSAYSIQSIAGRFADLYAELLALRRP